MKYLILFTLISCSTYKKTLLTAGTAGCLMGGVAASMIAKGTSKNRALNFGIFCTVGGAAATGAAHAMWEDNPLNSPLPPPEVNTIKMDLAGPTLNLNVSPKSKSKIPETHLPEEVLKKIPSRTAIEYEVPEGLQKVGDQWIYLKGMKFYKIGESL